MKIIDAWVQHPTDRLLARPYFDSLKRWMRQDLKTLPLEVTVGAMKAAQVDKALLTAWYGPEGDLISNEEVLAVVQAYPGLFYGVASADLRDPVAAVRTLRTYVTEHGFKALRIIQWLWELPCTHALYYPLLAACVELGVPVCLQVGLTGPLRSSESGRPGHIERIALDFPDLTIVCGHVGAPWHLEMIAYATKFPHVYLDTSAYLPSRYPPELVQYLKGHGKTKVLFGSNFPMITPEACLKQLAGLELDEDTAAHFLHRNAERVFKL